MIDPGHLHIKLLYDAGRVKTASIQSSRPLHINRVFIGKTPEQTLALLPLVFNVCSTAQSFAAITACQQALGITEDPKVIVARHMLLDVEIIREHCWWLLINIDKARLAPFIRMVDSFKQALFLEANAFSLDSQLKLDMKKVELLITTLENLLDEIFAGHRESLAAISNTTELIDWLKNNGGFPARLCSDVIANNWQGLGSCKPSFLPVLDNVELEQRLRQKDVLEFIKQPLWKGKASETGCLNRQQHQVLISCLLQEYGNGLLTRIMSRMLELANMPTLLRQRLKIMEQSVFNDSKTENQTGLAQIESSRGLLIHRVKLKQGIIQQYQIIAPTEWNFHPQGIAVQSLRQLKSLDKNTLQQQAALVINAIDPCVGYQLDI